jgi:hypothetical protein
MIVTTFDVLCRIAAHAPGLILTAIGFAFLPAVVTLSCALAWLDRTSP